MTGEQKPRDAEAARENGQAVSPTGQKTNPAEKTEFCHLSLLE